MANERDVRKATLIALGQPASAAQNEATYAKALTTGLKGTSKTKPQIAALTGSSTAADIVAALKA